MTFKAFIESFLDAWTVETKLIFLIAIVILSLSIALSLSVKDKNRYKKMYDNLLEQNAKKENPKNTVPEKNTSSSELTEIKNSIKELSKQIVSPTYIKTLVTSTKKEIIDATKNSKTDNDIYEIKSTLGDIKKIFDNKDDQQKKENNKLSGERFEKDIYNTIKEWCNDKKIKGYLMYQVQLDDSYFPRTIDILFVHRTGLYIIECKNWRGKYYSKDEWGIVFGIKKDEIHNKEKIVKFESPLIQVSNQRHDLNQLLRSNDLGTGSIKEIVVFSDKTDISNLDKAYKNKTGKQKYKSIVSETEIINCIENHIETFDYEHSESLDSKIDKIYDFLTKNCTNSDYDTFLFLN